MQFVIGYAGIPSAVFDAVRERRAYICGENCEFVARPLGAIAGRLSYSESDANYFLRQFAAKLREDHNNQLRDTGFALVYVSYESETTNRLRDTFFPSTLSIPVTWSFDQSSNKRIRECKNNLIELLNAATKHAKKAIPVLKKEVTERDNTTPLLLPIKNFESKLLVPELRRLQEALYREPDKAAVIAAAISSLERTHPRKRSDSSRRPCFFDNRDIQFHPPGSARHAFARGGDAHPDSCLVSGRRRLGAPYDRAFHYDCIKGNEPLRASFWGCHSGCAVREGKPHLNVAPNDFVRA